MKESVWAICERVAEVQALLDDHVAGGAGRVNPLAKPYIFGK
jgi:hypothetical protein